MHRFRAWGLSAALAAGVGAPAAVAADPPAPGAASPPARQPGEQTTVFKKLFGQPKPGAAMRPPTVTAPLPAEVVSDALRAERDAYLRRISVCTELRRVAAERNDDALTRQADELERQAAALYNQRTAALGAPRVKAPLPESPTAGLGGTYGSTPPAAALDRQLGTGVATNPLAAPAPPVPADPGVRTADASTPTVSPPARGEGRP